MNDQPFVPLLLGADINVYSMARAFHEAYGVKTVAYGMYPSGPCYSSAIIDYRVCAHNDEPEKVLENVRHVAAQFPDKTILLLGCGDNYLTSIAYRKGMGHDFALPFSGPFVVKPAESATYWDHPFPTQKKAYILQTREEVDQVIDDIYNNGYADSLIIQDFIPGGDENMRVLTCYSGADGRVRLMCLGHVLLEEHAPHAIGNHAVIITEDNEELCRPFRAFLEDIHFVGFSNFDIKYDSRDGKYKAFEINCRQGRSNYYVTGAGYNLAQFLVEDVVEHKPQELVVTKNRNLWCVLPKKVAYDYISPAFHQEMRELDRAGASVDPLWYRGDKALIHKLRIWNQQRRQHQKYAENMEKRKEI